MAIKLVKLREHGNYLALERDGRLFMFINNYNFMGKKWMLSVFNMDSSADSVSFFADIDYDDCDAEYVIKIYAKKLFGYEVDDV